jgi:hypothetical protein
MKTTIEKGQPAMTSRQTAASRASTPAVIGEILILGGGAVVRRFFGPALRRLGLLSINDPTPAFRRDQATSADFPT